MNPLPNTRTENRPHKAGASISSDVVVATTNQRSRALREGATVDQLLRQVLSLTALYRLRRKSGESPSGEREARWYLAGVIPCFLEFVGAAAVAAADRTRDDMASETILREISRSICECDGEFSYSAQSDIQALSVSIDSWVQKQKYDEQRNLDAVS